jgi:hypothetical protein
MPGVNLLAENDPDPVWLAVISVIFTIRGKHETCVFQEFEVVACARGIGTEVKTAENARRMTRLSKIRILGNFWFSLKGLLEDMVLSTKSGSAACGTRKIPLTKIHLCLKVVRGYKNAPVDRILYRGEKRIRVRSPL